MAKVSDKVLRESWPRYKVKSPRQDNLRPYNGECTGSRSISAVKPHLAQSVLWSGTTWEYCVL
ncbi:hypothetical protein BX666DRAFT_1926865 [Dichotomocladium elegans]|nr:hypothetical protein BX666DRAFT_2016118 [Dichotomocladium elegans]KAI9309835.1 hypothetical protein BX666DRAFT_2016061 [Dichotomocladium elegans]KAI9309860.1 hypothetical protein BX666DRAFT_2015777 [Dichotomocladium elegans]KAI9309925.1 hypothetical protein BX666DRAFT_2015169 [Dichotomocladium elegans]KAI9309982.1 hypothetical protein BX666DRAFT_2014170 [Dichotomocladium elegans]